MNVQAPKEFRPSGAALPGAVCYLHGGGYVTGEGEYADRTAAFLAEKLGVRVLRVSYRLAPQNPCPAALDDAQRAWCGLLETENTVPALLGDSSGGGLCFALALRLKKLGQTLPRAVIALSPWADLAGEDRKPGGTDGMLTEPLLRAWAAEYAAGRDLRDPELSPLYGDLSGLPECLLTAGGGELLATDARRLQAALARAGVPSRLLIGRGMWHTYPLYETEEARTARRAIRELLERVLA